MSMESPPSLNGHVVALPFPTRGHVNPMMNLCKFLASKQPTDIVITIVVTKEWLGFIQSYPKPPTIRFAPIPNVIPLDSQILDDVPAFTESLATKLKPAFQNLLDQLHPPVTAILSDAELAWPAAIAKQRNIPVALLWTMSASFFETFHQLDLLAPSPDRSLSVHLLGEQAEHNTLTSSSQLTDIQKLLEESDLCFLKIALTCISGLAKTDYLLLNTIQELEDDQINHLRTMSGFDFRLYPIGPAIPFVELEPLNDSLITNVDPVVNWLDSQPDSSVLYVSMGSSFSMSHLQMEELASALKTSGIRFLWVGRSETAWLKEKCGGDNGLVVPWCDQLKVLCHSSIAGFWSHCGWNSTLEACFAGVPILGFPIFLDQFSNCRHIVDVWKNGCKVGGERSEELVKKEEIMKVLKMVMDSENEEVKKIRMKGKELKALFSRVISKGGSFDMNMNAFVQDIF